MVTQKVRDCVAMFNSDIPKQGDFSFVDMDIDSLDLLEIAMEVESELGIEIPDKDIERLKNFSDLVKSVLKASEG